MLSWLYVFSSLFIFPLTLLILYPCQCFQRYLARFQLNFHALHTFMDAFQGCLKDGTDGTRDCRYFSAMYFGTGFLLNTVFVFTHASYFWPLSAVVHVCIGILHILFQPYKQAVYNKVACITYLFMALCCNSAMAVITAATSAPNRLRFPIILLAILIPLPQLCILGVFMHWLIYKKRVLHLILQKVRIWKPSEIAEIDFQEALPDRLANPAEYERLLSNPVLEEDNETFSTDLAY